MHISIISRKRTGAGPSISCQGLKFTLMSAYAELSIDSFSFTGKTKITMLHFRAMSYFHYTKGVYYTTQR